MKKVGIIGAGQLGQMLGDAGRTLGVECIFLDPSPEPPARTVGPVLRYPFDDIDGLRELASQTDVLTYEFENVPVAAIESIGREIDVFPPPAALRFAQDRLEEKRLFVSLGIPVPDFRQIDSQTDLERAADAIGLPLVLKTRRLGYDGKGQRIVRERHEIADAWQQLGSVPLIAEQMVSFDCEMSAIGVRNIAGRIITYPLTQNVHADGILRTSRAPAGTPELNALARDYHSRLADNLDYVGVLALELFVVGDTLLANEFAPRVHNSGHWTIEGAVTSQFENHLRAILDMALGDVTPVGHVAMENLIGSMPADVESIRNAGFHLHDYGKAPRAGRKLGHITLVAKDAASRERKLEDLWRLLSV